MGQHQSAIKIKANFREEGVKVFIFRESWTRAGENGDRTDLSADGHIFCES